MTLVEKFKKAVESPSDINFHIPILNEYAYQCNHITEMGVRDCVSTYAFLMAAKSTDAIVISYDIEKTEGVDECLKICLAEDVDWEFIKESSIEAVIEQTDLLFIDTLHTYVQLKRELELHAGKVNKYIAFHDIVSFARHGQDGTMDKGLMDAINEFLIAHYGTWKVVHYEAVNNGLMIIERI